MISLGILRWPMPRFLIWAFLLGVPLIDFVNGYALSVFGTSLFATIYKALIVPLVIFLFLMRKISKSDLLAPVSIFAGVILLISVPTLLGESRSNLVDVTVLLRGPITFGLVFLMMRFLRESEVDFCVISYFKFTWWIVSLSIVLLYLAGMSLSTYDGTMSAGSKGAYAAANELTIVYMLSWWFIVFRGGVSKKSIASYSAATLWMLFFIGTKSGFVVFGVIALWRILMSFKIKSVGALAIFTGIAGLVAANAGSLFLLIAPFLKGWERLLFFIERYDAVTVMTGGRFLDIPAAMSLFYRFSLYELVFGVGFEKFWIAVSQGSIESDLFDLFGGGGLIAISLFYGSIIYYLILCLKYRRLEEWVGVLLSVILYSIFVGHIAFAATPIISLALILSVISSSVKNENRRNSIVVQ